MKLLTKKNLKDLPPLYAQEKKGDKAVAYVKLFTPSSSFTWYITEFDGEDIFFGLVTSHMTPDGELGYASLKELQSVKGPLGLGVERDRWFDPVTLLQIKSKL